MIQKIKFSVSAVIFVQSSMLPLLGFAEYKIGGQVLLDADYFNGYFTEFDQDERSVNENPYTFESELRSAKVFFKADLSDHWKMKVKIALNSNKKHADIDDLYVRYTQWSFANVTIGKAKEPFSLENRISSVDLLAIERSMATSAFSPGRNYGLNFSDASGWYSWSLGLYQVTDSEIDKNEHPLAVTGRITLNHRGKENNLLHLGGSFSVREWKGADFEIESKAGVHTEVNVIDTRKVRAETINQSALEAGWIGDRCSILAEVFYQEIQAIPQDDDTNYGGYYLQGSYFITPAKRYYKKGKFDRVQPHDRSAWELITRYDVLDVAFDKRGNVVRNFLLGLNYYYGKHLKFMLNAIQSRSDNIKSDQIDTGNAFSLRAQWVY